jgi:glycosyltransferase involved in cell wall biosynthesis
VDNASTDNTEDVVRSIRDPRLRYVRNQANCGLILNQNRAIEEGKGDVIAVFHDHDLYHPDLVRRSMEILENNPRVGIVCSAIHMVDPDSPDKIHSTDIMSWKPISPGSVIRRELLHRWDSPVAAPTAMVRRQCYQEAGVFKPEFGGGADRELWLRILRNWDLGYIREPMARLRDRKRIIRFSPEQAREHWFSLKGQVLIQRVHLEHEFVDAPIHRLFERRRLRAKQFSEYWRAGIWAVAKGGNDEFLHYALEAFNDARMPVSAFLLRRLYHSKIAHSTFASAIQLCKQV